MLRQTLLVLALLGAPSLAGAKEMKTGHAAHTRDGTASDKAYAQAMNKMMGGMDVKPTGHPDRDFVAMMLPHHQGAVDMAQVELQYGKDPQLLAMARAIVDAQTREIAELHEWRSKHDK